MTRRAIITSDLHHGITSPVRILTLKNEMLAYDPDAIILAGDIGEPWMEFDKCLSIFVDSRCPVGIILGNHDIYATAGSRSEELWGTILPNIVEKYDFVWMETGNIVVDGTAFVGTMAWYDYSSRVPQFSHLSDDDFYNAKSRLVADGSYIDWARKDTDFAAQLKEGLLERLGKAQEDPAIKRIIVVTHVPLFREQMISYGSDSRQADAYFGNPALGKEVLKFSKITDVISGHTHRPVNKTVGNIRVQIVPGDYKRPGYIVQEF